MFLLDFLINKLKSFQLLLKRIGVILYFLIKLTQGTQRTTVELLHALESIEVVWPMSERSEPEISLKIKGLAGAVCVVSQQYTHSIHSKGQS